MNIGFIDYYLDEWHANNYPAWIGGASRNAMKVTHAYALIDSPKPSGRSTRAWCAESGVVQCASIEEVVSACDALVVLSPDNAEMHEQLCQIPLRSGKPTYIDKTFAPDGDAARRIFQVAEAAGTPCFSSSALRYAEEYAGICREGIHAIASWGPGQFETYAIHQLEPVMALINAAATRVQYIPAKDFYTLVISFSDGRQATVTGFLHGSPFTLNICADGGNRAVEAKADFFAPFIREMVAFFRTAREPVSHVETLRIMDVFGAGKRAMEAPGQWVDVAPR